MANSHKRLRALLSPKWFLDPTLVSGAIPRGDDYVR
jgi:hypothetical protein